jgi:hypothetical protein
MIRMLFSVGPDRFLDSSGPIDALIRTSWKTHQDELTKSFVKKKTKTSPEKQCFFEA